MSQIGHNSLEGQKLNELLERIESLKVEKQALQGDISDLFGEAKSLGYDTKAMRELIKLRAKGAVKVKEERTMLETYAHAVGCLDLI